MAVPKNRTSKQRKHSRNSANWKLSMPGVSECPQCHAMKLNHHVCKQCGYYDGKQILDVAKDEKKKN